VDLTAIWLPTYIGGRLAFHNDRRIFASFIVTMIVLGSAPSRIHHETESAFAGRIMLSETVPAIGEEPRGVQRAVNNSRRMRSSRTRRRGPGICRGLLKAPLNDLSTRQIYDLAGGRVPAVIGLTVHRLARRR
jgi:hypothetical protein